MMNSYIGVTDKQWFKLLRAQPGIEEVNLASQPPVSLLTTKNKGLDESYIVEGL